VCDERSERGCRAQNYLAASARAVAINEMVLNTLRTGAEFDATTKAASMIAADRTFGGSR
jgi:hypothetical protein